VSWDPFDTMRDLMTWDPFRALTQPLGRESGFAPAFEVWETPEAFVFEADLPGVEEKDVDISVTGNRLTVSGERHSEQREERGNYYALERSYGSFSRSFTLPEGVDADSVDAGLANGVLTIHAPKRAEVQPRKIKIGSSPLGSVVEKVKGMLGSSEKEEEKEHS